MCNETFPVQSGLFGTSDSQGPIKEINCQKQQKRIPSHQSDH